PRLPRCPHAAEAAAAPRAAATDHSADHVAEAIGAQRVARLDAELEGDGDPVLAGTVGAEALVDLVLVCLADRVEAADVQQRVVGPAELPPPTQVVAPVQELVEPA